MLRDSPRQITEPRVLGIKDRLRRGLDSIQGTKLLSLSLIFSLMTADYRVSSKTRRESRVGRYNFDPASIAAS